MKTIILKCFSKNIEDIKINCNDSDKEYYDGECINLFLKTFKD